jgi:phosphatidyl-myo-inositol dimannoside synthase
MRLLMVTQDFAPSTGGIQTYARELGARLSARSEAFHLVCPSALGQQEVDAGLPFPVHRAPCGSDTLPWLGAPLIAHLVSQHSIDVLLHVQWQTAAIGALLRRARKIRTLAIAVHGKELLLSPLAALPAAQRCYDHVRVRLLESADVVLPVSHFAERLVLARTSRCARIAVVANGVDAARLDRGGGRSFRERRGWLQSELLLSVGRLVPRKGIDRVIECLPALSREHHGLRYLVVGEGPDKPRLRALAAQHGVSGRVHFLGRLDDVELAACYAACDVFVLAGRDEPDSVEGFGLVLLEAGACGRATVATDAGGMREAVQHGETGLIVPTGDTAALSAALSRLLGDPELATRLGQAGRRRAYSEGSWDRAAKALYDALAVDAESKSRATSQSS